MKVQAFPLLLAMTTTVHADDPKLTAKASLLGDHLTLMLPADMKIAPRRASIMSAENAAEDETRAMLDAGKSRFVMMAYELYALAGANPKATIEADFTRAKYTGKLEPLALPKPLVGFAVTPPAVGADKDANLTYAAWIASGDGSVQFIAFYVNPDGAPQGASWSALAKKITATIGAGKRTLAPKAGDRTLGDLVITVTDGWVSSEQQGPDFTVYHLRKLAVLGGAMQSCGVYVGGHPSPQHTQTESKAKVTTTAGKLLGTKTDWSTSTNNGRSSAEALVPHPNGRLKVHAWCSADSEAELAEPRKVLESLRKK